MNQSKKQLNYERKWAKIFFSYFNKKNCFDYEIQSTPSGTPALDVIGNSKSGEYPRLNFELTVAKVYDYKNENHIVFDNNCVQWAIDKKVEKYKRQNKDITNLILLIQGYLSKEWMKDDIKQLIEQNKSSSFKGIYFIGICTTMESSFIKEIKKIQSCK